MLALRRDRKSGNRSARGYTLVEILVVVGILMMLIGLLLPVLAYARRRMHEVASKTMVDQLVLSLNNYRMTYGTFPVAPSVKGNPPDYYQIPCAAKGQMKDGSEDNSALVSLLHSVSNFNFSQANWVNGRLVDDFGSPVIVRFLTYSSGGQQTTRVYAWSYGYDHLNGIDASPTYSSVLTFPFDQPEIDRIEASLATPAPDDIVTH